MAKKNKDVSIDPIKMLSRKRRRKTALIVWGAIFAILLVLFLFGKMTHSVRLFGIVPEDKDAAHKNRKRLQTMAMLHLSGGTIAFDDGTYYIDGSIRLYGNQGLTIRGNGNTRIVNTAYDNAAYDNYANNNASNNNSANGNVLSAAQASGLLTAYLTSNLTVRDLSFSEADFPNLCGEIIANDLHGIQLKLVNADPEKLSGEQQILAVNPCDPDGNILADVYYNDSVTGSYDAETGIYTIKTYASSAGFKVGNQLIVRFSMTGKEPVFSLFMTKNTAVRNVCIESAGNGVIWGTMNYGAFLVDGLHIEVSENDAGGPLRWGSNSDGIHLNNESGTITVKNSVFIGMGDDAFNCNSLAIGVKQISGNELELRDPQGYNQHRFGLVRRGDTLLIYSKELELLKEVQVKSCWMDKAVLTEEIDIPDGCYAAVKRLMPKITIVDCTVKDGRARAFLLRSEDILVENCDISDLGLSGIIIAADINYWFEMAPSQNVTIRNNTFTNVATETAAQNLGIVMIKNGDDASVRKNITGTFRDITVTGNMFTDCGASALYAAGVDGLTFTDNTVTGQIDRLGTRGSDLVIRTPQCENVVTDVDSDE